MSTTNITNFEKILENAAEELGGGESNLPVEVVPRILKPDEEGDGAVEAWQLILGDCTEATVAHCTAQITHISAACHHTEVIRVH